MPDPAAGPPAPVPELTSDAGTVTLSTSQLGDLQVPGRPEQSATLRALAARAMAMRRAPVATAPTAPPGAYEAQCASLGRPLHAAATQKEFVRFRPAR